MKNALKMMFCVGILFFTYSQAEAQKKKKEVAEKAAVVTPTEDLKSLIQKKWQLDGEFFKAEMKKEIDKYKSSNPEKAAEIEAEMAQVDIMATMITLEFKADGTMEGGSAGEMNTGKWTLDTKTRILTMISTSGGETKVNIKEISNNKLVLENPNDEDMKIISFIPVKQ